MGHVGGIRYAYMYSYTHGVKPNVNLKSIHKQKHTLVYTSRNVTECYNTAILCDVYLSRIVTK